MERAFPTLMGRAKAMMNFAGLTTEKRKQLWCEAANTATMLDNILVHEQNSAPPYTMFYGQDAKYAKHLQTFGENCVTADTYNQPRRMKLDARGRLCMFMGYSTQHAEDVYRFLHMKTNHIIYKRDVQWLGKMWHEFYSIPSIYSADSYLDSFDDYIEETGTEQEIESNAQVVEPTPIKTERTGLEEEEPFATRTKSHDSEPIVNRIRSQQDLTDIAGVADVKTGSNLQEWLNEIVFVTNEMNDPSEPQTFQQARWHRDAIKLDFNKMISMGDWRKVGSTSIPSGRRLVGCCWVFKIKRFGIYHAILDAK